jgi:hypothetical protein
MLGGLAGGGDDGDGGGVSEVDGLEREGTGIPKKHCF